MCMCVCVQRLPKSPFLRARARAMVVQYAPQSRVTIYPGCKKVFASRLMKYVR